MKNEGDTYFWLIRRRTFVGCCKVMVLHVLVREDVPVDVCVLSGAEVPRLLLRVVRTGFKALQLVLEVQNVVGLLVT